MSANQQSVSQPDGFSERDAVHDQWIPPVREIHAERRMMMGFKSGPAWDRPVSVDLAKSLQAQALKAAGECLQAIDRHQLRDVLPAWQRLTKAMEITFPEGMVWSHLRHGATTVWDTLQTMVTSALANAQALDAPRQWILAESCMRAAALQRIQQLTRELDIANNLTDEDLLEDGPADKDRIIADLTYFAPFAYPVNQAVTR